jgi:hypothetical protein
MQATGSLPQLGLENTNNIGRYNHTKRRQRIYC